MNDAIKKLEKVLTESVGRFLNMGDTVFNPGSKKEIIVNGPKAALKNKKHGNQKKIASKLLNVGGR